MRACTVASSAVVGSSAMSSRGRSATAEAMSARWRMPPESSSGALRRPQLPARAGPTSSSSSITRCCRSRRPSGGVQAERVGDLAPDRPQRVERRRGRPASTRPISRPRRLRSRRGRGIQDVGAVEAERGCRHPRPRPGEPQHGPRGDALARAGLADEGEALARLDRERDAVDTTGAPPKSTRRSRTSRSALIDDLTRCCRLRPSERRRPPRSAR